MISLLLGYYTHSFFQEDHHALSRYRSTCMTNGTTAKSKNKSSSELPEVRGSDRDRVLVSKLNEGARITKQRGTEIRDRHSEDCIRLSDQSRAEN